jgi:hypothetical protein
VQRRGNYKIHVAPSKHARKEWQGNKDSGLNDKQDKNQKKKMPTSPSHEMPNTRSTVHFLKNGKTQKT